MMHATRIIPSLAIVLLSGGQAVGQPAARNEASCAILASRAGPAVEIRGEIQVPVAKLSLSLGDNKVECSRTIRGNELDEL